MQCSIWIKGGEPSSTDVPHLVAPFLCGCNDVQNEPKDKFVQGAREEHEADRGEVQQQPGDAGPSALLPG